MYILSVCWLVTWIIFFSFHHFKSASIYAQVRAHGVLESGVKRYPLEISAVFARLSCWMILVFMLMTCSFHCRCCGDPDSLLVYFVSPFCLPIVILPQQHISSRNTEESFFSLHSKISVDHFLNEKQNFPMTVEATFGSVFFFSLSFFFFLMFV